MMIPLQRQLARNFRQIRSFTVSSILPSNKDEKDDNSKLPTTNKISKEEAASKLNNLLNLMIQEDNDTPKKEIKLAQAVKRRREIPVKEKPFAEKLEVAAKNVAATLGGDVEKTESELLNILLRKSDAGNLEDVLKGLKVQKSEAPSKAQEVRNIVTRQMRSGDEGMEKKKHKRKSNAVMVDILGSEPTNYFTNMQPTPPPCELRTWQSCVERDMRLAVTHPPANIYEQLIQWTDRGMVWQFPIDNEQGLDKEKQVPFEDHIFLEDHLEGWCPEKGPIRHFMELVCVGLSKNYWLTAEEKKEHIFWFRDYFADKKQLIAEIGAGNIAFEPSKPKEVSQ